MALLPDPEYINFYLQAAIAWLLSAHVVLAILSRWICGRGSRAGGKLLLAPLVCTSLLAQEALEMYVTHQKNFLSDLQLSELPNLGELDQFAVSYVTGTTPTELSALQHGTFFME